MVLVRRKTTILMIMIVLVKITILTPYPWRAIRDVTIAIMMISMMMILC